MLTVAEQKAIEASREYNATVAKFMEQEKLLSDRLFEEKEIEKALVEKNLKLEDEIKSCEAMYQNSMSLEVI